MVFHVLFTPQPTEDPTDPPGETYNEGIYANPDGLLQLLIKQGDAITLGPGDVRTLRYFWMNPYSDNGFNDRGELLIEGYFDDGTFGLLLINVPEPASTSLLVSGLVALGALKRRRLALVLARREAA